MISNLKHAVTPTCGTSLGPEFECAWRTIRWKQVDTKIHACRHSNQTYLSVSPCDKMTRPTPFEDVDLSLEPQAVIISGKAKAKGEGEEEGRGERSRSTVDDSNSTVQPSTSNLQPAPAWSRRLELPFRISTEKANAKFTNGILRIELPKADAPGVRKIVIS